MQTIWLYLLNGYSSLQQTQMDEIDKSFNTQTCPAYIDKCKSNQTKPNYTFGQSKPPSWQ